MTLLLVAKLNFNPQVLRWLDRLRALRVRVVCLHIGAPSEVAPIRARIACPVYCLFEDNARQGGLRSIGRMFAAYRRVLHAEQPDVVWALCLWTLLAPLAWMLRTLAIPLVVTACGSDVNTGARRLRNRLIFRYVLAHASLVCTTTPEMMARITEFAPIPPERRLVLYWGIDTEIFVAPNRTERAMLRERWGIADDAPVIYMGRILRPIAYYREALAAIAATARTRDLAALRLIFIDWASDARVVEEVRVLLEEYGLSAQTIFIERELDAAQLREIYAVSDLALNLMRQDQLGATIFESLAVGCLVVTTDLPQYRRIAQEGVRLWFVRTSHVEADLARVLGELFEQLPEAKRSAVLPNQELVRQDYRFDRNSLLFVNAVRRLCGPVPTVYS
jgi:glycosyltransferase involved in cell wall biosynthesis